MVEYTLKYFQRLPEVPLAIRIHAFILEPTENNT